MYDLVVLGGGSGGLSVAKAAARFGAKVALVEKHDLGGECTHSACVPSKALIHAARLAHEIRGADRFGIRAGSLDVDFRAVMARVRSVVKEFAGSGSGDSLRAKGIDVYRGNAAFDAYDTVILNRETRINALRFVIATGSRAVHPSIPGLAEVGFLDNANLWSLEELPRELVVIGAGPSGIEFAQAFARLGSRVTVLAETEQILPKEDTEVAQFLQRRLESEGIEFHLGVTVAKVSRRDKQTTCSWKKSSDGTTGDSRGTHLLVAAGRLANVEDLNLEAVGIHADAEHGIEVNEYLQTRSSRIYALGDVLLQREFTHAAQREAEVVFQNAVLRLSKKIDYSALPWTTFVDPEVATVGLSAAEAEEKYPEIRVFRADYADLDRARIDGLAEGFAKVVTTPTGKILGATVVGEQASSILQEFVLAMENGLTLNDIAATTHPYPTYLGLAHAIANQYAATRLESGFMQALKWFLGIKSPSANAENTHSNGSSQESATVEPATHNHAH